MSASVSPSQDANRRGPSWAIGAVAIVAAVVAAYLPSLANGFVWNDSDYVTRADLRGLAGLLRIWSEPGATEQYYPVLHTAFWAEHRLWGDAPMGYHLVNVALHALNAVLLWRVLGVLALPGAWFAALFYGLHPVCVESVAWISEQKNTLSTAFFLLAALTYLRRDGAPGLRLYLVACGLYVLAILSKSAAAPLPAALLVIAWWRRGTVSWRNDVLPLLPWLLAGAAVGLFTAQVERTSIGAEGSDFALGAVARVLVAGRALWFYLGKLAWPSPLIFMYPRWAVDAGAAWQYLYPALAAGGVVAAWAVRGRSRGPLAAALLFGGLLFPVLGFLNVYAFVFSYVADHFQYLACMVPLAALAALVPAGVLKRAGPWIAAGLALLTWQRCHVYSSSETLYRSILADNADAWLPQYNLANLLRESGHPAEAERHYRETLRIKPGHLGAKRNLALALMTLGRPGEAVTLLEAVVRDSPRSAAVENDLGIALWAAGRPAEAVAHYRQALLIDPNLALAWYNLGLSLDESGHLPETIYAFGQAVRSQAGFTDASRHLGAAHNALGLKLLAAGRPAEAVGHFQKAMELLPDVAGLRHNLAEALRASGQPGTVQPPLLK